MGHIRLSTGRAGHLTLHGSDLSKETAQLKPGGLGLLSSAEHSADRLYRVHPSGDGKPSHCVASQEKKQMMGQVQLPDSICLMVYGKAVISSESCWVNFLSVPHRRFSGPSPCAEERKASTGDRSCVAVYA